LEYAIHILKSAGTVEQAVLELAFVVEARLRCPFIIALA
jgi:hypothetical protein